MRDLWVQIHELRVQIHECKNHLINENSSFKSFGNSWRVRSVSGDNFMFYFSTISRLRLHKKVTDDFGETYLYLI